MRKICSIALFLLLISGITFPVQSATRKELFTMLAAVSVEVNKDLPDVLEDGVTWTKFDFTRSGSHGVPEIYFTITVDLKEVLGDDYSAVYVNGHLSKEFRKNFMTELRQELKKEVIPMFKEGIGDISKADLLRYQIGLTIFIYDSNGESIGSLFYKPSELYL